MNVGDIIKVVRLNADAELYEEEALLGNVFKVYKVYEDCIKVKTEVGVLEVYEGEYEVLISETDHLNQIDLLETEIARLQEQVEELQDHLQEVTEDLFNITKGF